jgi:hypothetical protein
MEQGTSPTVWQSVREATENITSGLSVLWAGIRIQIRTQEQVRMTLQPSSLKGETIAIGPAQLFIAKRSHQSGRFEPIKIGIYFNLSHFFEAR